MTTSRKGVKRFNLRVTSSKVGAHIEVAAELCSLLIGLVYNWLVTCFDVVYKKLIYRFGTCCPFLGTFFGPFRRSICGLVWDRIRALLGLSLADLLETILPPRAVQKWSKKKTEHSVALGTRSGAKMDSKRDPC